MLKVKAVGLPLLLIFLAVGCGGKAVQSIKKTLPEQQISSRVISQPSSLLELVPSGNILSLADDLDVASLSLAIDRSLQYFSRFNDKDVYYMGARQFTVGEMEETLNAFRQIVTGGESDQTKQNKIRDTFDFYKSLGDDKKGRVIFTGYYEPILNGSLEKTKQYQYPLYRTPDETVVLNAGKFVGRMGKAEVLPHYKRAEIDSEKSLAGRNLEIIWVDDFVDLFFLQIQGSGKVRLPDGKFIQVGYAQSNGYPYRSIANYMVDKGLLSKNVTSLQAIKKYLREHPDEMERIFNYNERYIFFRLMDKGPIGSLGIPVTGGRTIASDPEVFPKGALAFIRTRKPLLDKGEVVKWITFSRFVLNQDTGAAINGAGRIDIFCGGGAEAADIAGRLKEGGELIFLLKKR
jgi:membrane-bound lytic murein transglycosylase A